MLQELAIEIAAFSVLGFGAVLFVAQIAAREVGYWFGRRRAAEEAERPSVGLVVGGMLGLLGFVLALTLAFSSTRFEERRNGSLAEANAIGTSWLRARAVGHPLGDEIARQLVDYTRLRIEFVRAGTNSPELPAINQRTLALQSAIWNNLMRITQQRQDFIAGSLMTSLNETFDRAMAERFAFALSIPAQLLWLLVGLALTSIAGVGYQLGLQDTPLRLLSLLLIGMWTIVMTTVLDLGAPRLGDLRTSIAAYEWTLSGFSTGPGVPAAPSPR